MQVDTLCKGEDFFQNATVNVCVAHDATFAYVIFAGLKLRLNEGDDVCLGREPAFNGW